MGKGRKFNKAPKVRPRKNNRERRRRDLVQKKRLIGLGVPAETVAGMTTRDIKDMLKRPARIAKSK